MSEQKSVVKTTGPLHNKVYKSRPCRNFAKTGSCIYNEKCQFAHGPEELAKWKARHERIQRKVDEHNRRLVESLTLPPLGVNI